MRGLLTEGKRKSIEPMAARLPDGNCQALQQFVASSPWDAGLVRARLAHRMEAAIVPVAWVVDDTGFLKVRDRFCVCGAAVHPHRGEGDELSGGGVGAPGHRRGLLPGELAVVRAGVLRSRLPQGG